MRLMSVLSWLLLPACGFLADGNPTVEAFRIGGGEAGAAENSAAALEQALSAGWPAIHADLQLAQDGVPVLYADGILRADRCTRADGSPLDADTPIRSLDSAALQTGFLCDGEPLLSLSDLLAAAAAAPDLRLHLSATGDPDAPEGEPAALAAALAAAVRDADPPNPWYLSSDDPAFLSAARDAAPGTRRCRWWPGSSADPAPPGAVAGAESLLALGLADPLEIAADAGADCLILPPALLDLGIARAAAADGIALIAATPDGDSQLSLYCGWPIHTLLTAAPGAAPCL